MIALLVAGTTALSGGPVAGATCASSVGPGIAPPASVATGIPGFHAAWYGQSGYMTLCPGDQGTATVAYINSGSRGWVLGRAGETAYLGTSGPEPGQDRPSQIGGDGRFGSPNTGWPSFNRLAVQPASYVGPGQVAWFQFRVQAPMIPGTYRIALRPLVEGSEWLEDYGVFWVVTVPAQAVTTPVGTPTPVSQPLTVTIVSSTYGYLAAVTSPGAVCSARAALPSGNLSTAQGLQVSANADAAGSVAWAYTTVTTTLAGTGVHTVTCTLGSRTAQSSASFTVLAAAPTPAPSLTIRDIDGLATLIADDGTYLGMVSSSRYDSASICNRYGDYGSKYSSDSVRNTYGSYGSPYSSDSAYNAYTSTPPSIYYRGRAVGYLTKNKYLSGALDPDVLFAAYDCVY